jgi:phenol/toluene 2-monooxygenase (NADH) P1/A1
VVRDPFEVFVAQNVALDGLLYPLIYGRIVDEVLSSRGGAAVALLTQFMTAWFEETRKWVDAVMKVTAAESTHNRTVLQDWTRSWSARAAVALLPVAELALGSGAEAALAEELAALHGRLQKSGVMI